jgi:hypothetical protein
MLLLLLLFWHALTCQGDEEEAPLRRWQKLQLPVVHAVLQQEPKCFSNGCYIQTLDSYNTFGIAGMNNPSLLGFHILDMLMILLLLLFLLFLLLQYLLVLVLVPLPVAAAATQSPLPFHLLLPTALQQMVLDSPRTHPTTTTQSKEKNQTWNQRLCERIPKPPTTEAACCPNLKLLQAASLSFEIDQSIDQRLTNFHNSQNYNRIFFPI